MNLKELYQEIILEHGKNPRNLGKIENYNNSQSTEVFEKKITKKSDNPECLLNKSNGDVPRNKRCPVTNMKFKQCCGKL